MTLLLSLYALICLFFLDNTYREGEIGGGGWDVMRILGLMACLVWPLMLFYVIACAYRDRHAS